MTEENKSPLNLAKYISITIVISILSQISLASYYSVFGLQPFSYYDLSEILMSSTKDFIIVSIILFLFMQTVAVNTRPTDFELFETKKPIENEFLRYLNKNYIPVGLQAMNFIVAIIYYLRGRSAFIFFGSFIFFLIIELIKHNTSRYNNIKETDPERFDLVRTKAPYIDLNLLMIGILYVCFISLISQSKANHARYSNKYIGSLITLNSTEKIKVTSKVLLIGKNKDYMFLYNTPDSSIRVLKMSDVSKLVIKNNDRSFKASLIYTY